MEEIIFVTGNKGKVATASRVLENYGIKVIQHSLNFSEPDISDQKIIAVEKAKYASKILGKPLITEDSGFFVHSLDGYPGARSHRILDMGVEATLNYILEKVDGKDRSCEFRSTIAYWGPGIGEPITFDHVYKGAVAKSKWEGESEGKSYTYKGWSPLDFIFIPEGFNGPLANPNVRKEFRKQLDKVSNFKNLGEWLSKE